MPEPSMTNMNLRRPQQAGATMPMRVLVFASQKGGSGKTTLCGQLAVQAELAERGPVALIDTDPQGSLADWWNARSDETPLFVRTHVNHLHSTLEELRGMGVKLVCIDSQPTVTEVISEIIRMGDLVIIPTRPSPHDLRAVGPTLDIVEKCNKPMVFVVNGATRKARITSDVAVALSQHGTVAPVTVNNRTDFATSMINGKTVMETNPDGASAKEIGLLWDYLAERLDRLEPDEGHLAFDGLLGPPLSPAEPNPMRAEQTEPPQQPEWSGPDRRQESNVGRRDALRPSFGRRISDVHQSWEK